METSRYMHKENPAGSREPVCNYYHNVFPDESDAGRSVYVRKSFRRK